MDFEADETNRYLDETCPIMIRLDGRSFHTFTRGLTRPYDHRLSDLMVDLTKYLVQETHAVIGYTQSDEISLVLYKDKPNTQLFFAGRIHKIVSITASMATCYFNKHVKEFIPEKASINAHFDSRAWSVPSLDEAVESLARREHDAIKNSIATACRTHFGHDRVFLKDTNEMKAMLLEKGIDWNLLSEHFKRGTYVKRYVKSDVMSFAELEKLPPKHFARSNKSPVCVKRNVIDIIKDLPELSKILNKTDVLFYGEAPRIIENSAMDSTILDSKTLEGVTESQVGTFLNKLVEWLTN